jgi:hypothetical protein
MCEKFGTGRQERDAADGRKGRLGAGRPSATRSWRVDAAVEGREQIRNQNLGWVGGNSKFKIQNSKFEIRGGRAGIPHSSFLIQPIAPHVHQC